MQIADCRLQKGWKKSGSQEPSLSVDEAGVIKFAVPCQSYRDLRPTYIPTQFLLLSPNRIHSLSTFHFSSSCSFQPLFFCLPLLFLLHSARGYTRIRGIVDSCLNSHQPGPAKWLSGRLAAESRPSPSRRAHFTICQGAFYFQAALRSGKPKRSWHGKAGKWERAPPAASLPKHRTSRFPLCTFG